MSSFFLDGNLVEGGSVEQSLLSRGFAFGFGVFETMKFLDGEPCFFGEHLARLRRAVSMAGFEVSLAEGQLRQQARALFAVEGVTNGVFKIVISDAGDSVRTVMFVRSRELAGEGAAVRLRASRVVKASRAFTSRNKSLNYMESVLELGAAKAAGFDECVFFNEFGQLTECSVANLFFVKDGVLRTPALSCGLLDGIVRAKVLEIARGKGLAVEEGEFSELDLLAADEVFLTSSGGGPRSAADFEALSGSRTCYGVTYLPDIRRAYLEMESEEARLRKNV